jgi:hypothetical protein
MQGRNHTAWKQNPTITIMFHESIAILLKNAPFFEVPFQFLPRHARGQHGQRVAEINHLIQAAAEEIGRVAHQSISTKLPENNAFRG